VSPEAASRRLKDLRYVSQIVKSNRQMTQ
jgi:hypothetical protein